MRLRTGCLKKVGDLGRLMEKASNVVAAAIEKGKEIQKTNAQSGVPLALDYDPVHRSSS